MIWQAGHGRVGAAKRQGERQNKLSVSLRQTGRGKVKAESEKRRTEEKVDKANRRVEMYVHKAKEEKLRRGCVRHQQA